MPIAGTDLEASLWTATSRSLAPRQELPSRLLGICDWGPEVFLQPHLAEWEVQGLTCTCTDLHSRQHIRGVKDILVLIGSTSMSLDLTPLSLAMAVHQCSL